MKFKNLDETEIKTKTHVYQHHQKTKILCRHVSRDAYLYLLLEAKRGQ